jgi:phenylalanyl-tRNA synthetase alpha chain
MMQKNVIYSEEEYKVLTALSDHKNRASVSELTKILNIDQSKISASGVTLAEKGLLTTEAETHPVARLGREGETLAGQEFPERKALNVIAESDDGLSSDELQQQLHLEKSELGQVIRWLMTKQWCRQQAGKFVISEQGKNALKNLGDDEILIQTLIENESLDENQATELGINFINACNLLRKRGAAIKLKEKTTRIFVLTDLGKQQVQAGVQYKREVSELTQQMLTTGEWRNVRFKPYNVKLDTVAIRSGKSHPLQRIIDEIRKVFLELGFTEIVSPVVESAFWDFDALFQPQDHPAREMQDTFYTQRPSRAALPKQSWVDEVRATHENGGRTGSLGWRYKWQEKKAQQTVLRTHTTATTVRHLANHPFPPQKVFCVGSVFRREKITYKHLTEFHQVDGIIIDKGATLSTLLGTLTEFYRKMGFEKIKFRPAFFPYTEPSVEVFVQMKTKKGWIELGGSGVFRPEVYLPFGCPCPVLAWGLGIERLAMMRYNLDDIRHLYWSDLSMLKEVSLCR